jgi:hypothetical protein
MFKQFWAVSLMSLQTLPQRIGASSVIVVGIAGVLAARSVYLFWPWARGSAIRLPTAAAPTGPSFCAAARMPNSAAA